MTPKSSTPKTPAYAFEAEMAALGAALVEKWAAKKIVQMTGGNDYALPAHRLIFEAIERLVETDWSVDVVTLTEELNRVNALGEIDGGSSYLAKLIDKCTSTAHIEHYARIVLEASLSRQITNQLTETSRESSPANVRKLGDLILALQGTRGGTIFDMREDLGPMVESILDHVAKGTPTGFEGLDRLMNGGPVAEELMTIGARPGDGKTAVMLKMACNMAEKMAMEGNPDKECILYLTTEMTVKSLVQRILPMVTGIKHNKFRTGSLTKDDRSKVLSVCDDLTTFPLKIMGKSSLSIEDIKAAVYQAKPKVVFIDYLQRCRLPKADNMAYALGDFMAQLKSFMVDCQIAGVIGCQSDRELDKFPDQPPTMSHLKGSGGIESESDVVIMLWRPSSNAIAKKHDWVQPAPGCIAIEGIIRKARSGQNGQDFGLQLQGELIKMTDRLPTYEPRQEEFR